MVTFQFHPNWSLPEFLFLLFQPFWISLHSLCQKGTENGQRWSPGSETSRDSKSLEAIISKLPTWIGTEVLWFLGNTHLILLIKWSIFTQSHCRAYKLHAHITTTQILLQVVSKPGNQLIQLLWEHSKDIHQSAQL